MMGVVLVHVFPPAAACPTFSLEEPVTDTIQFEFLDPVVGSMFDPKWLDEISRRLAIALPQDLQAIQGDLRQNLDSALESLLGRLDLVTREEFEVQAAVLARTRQKLQALEAQVSKLESSRRST